MHFRKKAAVIAAVLVAGLCIPAAAQSMASTGTTTGGSDPQADSRPVTPALVNKGPIDPKTWKYGPRNDDTTNAPVWNPAKKKMLAGARLVGGTVDTVDPQVYCSVAGAGYDFTWTEMQHAGTDWADVAAMWRSCPTATVPGVRVANTDEREIQHALDEGAMVLVVPTVDTAAEAAEVVQWSYFPPMGRRSQGGGQANAFYQDVPGGYRQTFNENLVVIVMIETIEGVKNVDKIANTPGVDAVFVAGSDLGNFSGYKEGDPDYERLVTTIHDAAFDNGKRLCGPLKWQSRGGFSCFQGGSNGGLIKQGAADELGG